MDNEKIYRHVLVISQNIDRMTIHYDYAVRHLQNLVQELEGSGDKEKWERILELLESNQKIFEEANDVDWEKEKKKYKDKLF